MHARRSGVQYIVSGDGIPVVASGREATLYRKASVSMERRVVRGRMYRLYDLAPSRLGDHLIGGQSSRFRWSRIPPRLDEKAGGDAAQ